MRRRRDRAGLLAALVVGAVSLLLAGLGLPSTYGALTGTVRNSSNTAASAVVPATTCTAAAIALGAYFAYPFDENAGATVAADVSGNNRPGAYQNPLLGITFGAAGPCPRDRSRSVTLNGSTGYVAGPGGNAVAGTNVFTEAIWFRTTTTTGGKLIGFGNTRTGQSGSYDRHIYMSSNGTLTFGVYPGAVRTATSTASYNDGAWHFAAASLGTDGMKLYVDGTLVATTPGTTTAEGYAGFWRVGYDNLGSWPNQPSSFYFNGSLAYASVYTTTLTAAQVQSLYLAGR